MDTQQIFHILLILCAISITLYFFFKDGGKVIKKEDLFEADLFIKVQKDANELSKLIESNED